MMRLTPAVCMFVLTGLASAQSVDAVLARMDRAAPDFHAMTANVHMVTYTAILNDSSPEDGTLEMQRLKAQDVRAILKFQSQTIAFLGKIVTIYYPKLAAYQEYNFGKNSNVLNQFLLLGFGSSGKELSQGYKISMVGSEKVAGRDTSKLQLLPKDKSVQERLQKVEIWIPNDAAYPVQQQFYEPSGNYRKVTYSNIVLNPSIKGTLELHLPPGTRKQS